MKPYKGKGEHSVNELEQICDEQQEKLHQMQLQKQDLLLTLQQIQFAVKSGAVKGLFKDEIDKMDNAIKKATE